MDIITIETSTNLKKIKPLIDTWQHYGISGTILGQGTMWSGFITKLEILKEYLNTCTHDIVLFTDSRDVVFAANHDDILNTFLSANVKILFGAETNLYPNKTLLHGDEKSKYRYLNSGMFIGYTYYLRKVFDAITLHPSIDDQEALQNKYLENYNIVLDTNCILFQNLWDEYGGRSCNFDMLYQPTYVKNAYTNTFPKIFHAPGPTTVLTQAYKVAMRLY